MAVSPDTVCGVLTRVCGLWQERQHLVAEVQQRVDRLKKEQKKRDALTAKIKVNSYTTNSHLCRLS